MDDQDVYEELDSEQIFIDSNEEEEEDEESLIEYFNNRD